ncbi:MAG: PKD domain-containing protein, partial [Salibacteraceae bacterium]
ANSSPGIAVSSSYTFSPSAANAAGNMDDGWVKFTSSTQTIGYEQGTSHYVGPVSTGGKGTYTFDVTGAPNTGPITINTGFAFDASKTGTLPPINLHYNWALIGNPFPSTISWGSVEAASSDVESSAYIFEQDDLGWTAATNIPPFQAFMVRVDGGSPSVVFNESAKVTTQEAFIKSIQENDFLELYISSANTTQRSYAKLEFNSNYSDSYLEEEDAYRVLNPSPWPNVAFMSTDGSPLQFNMVSNTNGHKIVPINAMTYQTGNHTLTFENLDKLEGCFVLEDLIENKQITLTPSNNTYTFLLSDTTTADRFQLHIYEFAQEVTTNNSACYGTNSGNAEVELFNLGSDYFVSLLDENGTSIQTEFNASGKQSFTDLAPGKYAVEVSSNALACPSANEYFTIMEPGEMKTDFDFGTDSLLFYVNEEITFNNLSSGDIMNYEWNFGDNITSTLMNPKHAYFTDGVYSVQLTASNGNSDCDVNSKKVIQVMNGRVSVEDIDKLNTSVKQIENKLMITSDAMISEYEILDLSGKTLDSKNTIQNNSYHIDINGFDAGVYILVLKLEEGLSYTHKFYKK